MSQYEFDDRQNATIGGLAVVMRSVATLELVVGVVFAGVAVLAAASGALPSLIIYGALAIVSFVIGFALRSSAVAMRAVVGTTGADITHMMTGLVHLRRYFTAQKIMLMLFVLLFLAAIAVAIWLFLN